MMNSSRNQNMDSSNRYYALQSTSVQENMKGLVQKTDNFQNTLFRY